MGLASSKHQAGINQAYVRIDSLTFVIRKVDIGYLAPFVKRGEAGSLDPDAATTIAVNVASISICIGRMFIKIVII